MHRVRTIWALFARFERERYDGGIETRLVCCYGTRQLADEAKARHDEALGAFRARWSRETAGDEEGYETRMRYLTKWPRWKEALAFRRLDREVDLEWPGDVAGEEFSYVLESTELEEGAV